MFHLDENGYYVSGETTMKKDKRKRMCKREEYAKAMNMLRGIKERANLVTEIQAKGDKKENKLLFYSAVKYVYDGEEDERIIREAIDSGMSAEQALLKYDEQVGRRSRDIMPDNNVNMMTGYEYYINELNKRLEEKGLEKVDEEKIPEYKKDSSIQDMPYVSKLTISTGQVFFVFKFNKPVPTLYESGHPMYHFREDNKRAEYMLVVIGYDDHESNNVFIFEDGKYKQLLKSGTVLVYCRPGEVYKKKHREQITRTSFRL